MQAYWILTLDKPSYCSNNVETKSEPISKTYSLFHLQVLKFVGRISIPNKKLRNAHLFRVVLVSDERQGHGCDFGERLKPLAKTRLGFHSLSYG